MKLIWIQGIWLVNDHEVQVHVVEEQNETKPLADFFFQVDTSVSSHGTLHLKLES